MTVSVRLPACYTRLAIWLHWLIAFGIVANFLLIWTLGALPESWARPAINLHKSIGLTVLGLAVLRLLWRATHDPPALPASYPRVERLGAHLAHALLYGLMVAMPLTGYIHDSAWKDGPTHPLRLFGLVPFPRIGPIEALAPAPKQALHDQFAQAHGLIGWALLGLFVLHVVGALKHQWIDHAAELQRMGVGR